MSSTNTLVKHGSLKIVKKKLDTLKTKSRRIDKEINNILTKSTAIEKLAYEKALKKYTDKMNAVLDKEVIKNKLEEKYTCDEKMYDIFTQVKNNYEIAVATIMKQPLTNDEKDSKIQRLQHATCINC